ALPDEVHEARRGLPHDPDPFLSRDIGVGYGDRVRAARHRHVGERERGGAHVEDRELRRDRVRRLVERNPTAHAHAHLSEASRRGLVDVLENEHVFGFADVVHPPGAHQDRPPAGLTPTTRTPTAPTRRTRRARSVPNRSIFDPPTIASDPSAGLWRYIPQLLA